LLFRIQPKPNSSSLDKLKLSDVVTRNIQSVVKELSQPQCEPGFPDRHHANRPRKAI